MDQKKDPDELELVPDSGYYFVYRLALFGIWLVTALPVLRVFGSNPSAAWASTPQTVLFKYAYGNFQTNCNIQSDTGCTITWPGVTVASQANVVAMAWMSVVIVLTYNLVLMFQLRNPGALKVGTFFRDMTQSVSLTLAIVPPLYFVGYTTVNDVLLVTLSVYLYIVMPGHVSRRLTATLSQEKSFWSYFVPHYILGIAIDIILWLPIVVAANQSSFSASTGPIQQALYATAALGIVNGTGMVMIWRGFMQNATYYAEGYAFVAREILLTLQIWTTIGLWALAVFYNRQVNY